MKVKLVRDKMAERDGEVIQPVNTRSGKHALLLLKLHEEAEEIARAATDPEEYADLLEAMLELARMNGVTWPSIEEALLKKREERGGFRRGMVMIRGDGS